MSSSLEQSEELLESIETDEARHHAERVRKLSETYARAQQLIELLSQTDLENDDVFEQLDEES